MLDVDPHENPLEFWNGLYLSKEQVWSGKVNQTLAAVVSELPPGRSLDLGCGEGGDVLWLAEQGWQATGFEISDIAVERARAEAQLGGWWNGLTLGRTTRKTGSLLRQKPFIWLPRVSFNPRSF